MQGVAVVRAQPLTVVHSRLVTLALHAGLVTLAKDEHNKAVVLNAVWIRTYSGTFIERLFPTVWSACSTYFH